MHINVETRWPWSAAKPRLKFKIYSPGKIMQTTQRDAVRDRKKSAPRDEMR